ncbi:unnamed protein product [Meloidogyne enterolobii]|uniref:Uncharacterized protein n=1 Tax=Meloidogyne enterolobii TaxID=390850 RepID=A0ACB0YEU7_MELEN
MKPVNILFFLIFNSILWSLINSVKNNKNQNKLTRVEETSNDSNKILNDGAESSVAPQIEKYKETLKPKIIKNEKASNNKEGKSRDRKGYQKDYYQKNKERILQNRRESYKKIKDGHDEDKKEKKREYNREYKRKCRLRKKIEKEMSRNDISQLTSIQSDNNEGTSFVNPQNNESKNKGKEPIVSKENVQLSQGNIHLQKDTFSQSTHIEEGNSFNSQIGCETNSENPIYCPCEQEKVNHHENVNQQDTNLDDLDGLNLLDDQEFFDYLNKHFG